MSGELFVLSYYYLPLLVFMGVIVQAVASGSDGQKVRYERVPKELLVLRQQNRQHDSGYLARLSESLAKGQLQPIGVLKDYMVIWGNARVLAARMNPHITHVWVAIFDEPISEREWQRMRFIENQLRQDLSNAEKCLNAIEYAKSEPNLTLKQIAADLGDVDASMVTRWLAYDKCIEAVQQALADDKLTLNGMYALSKLPPEQQEAALEAALHGSSRKQRDGNSVKMSRIKCQMCAGVVVTLAGEGNGFDLNTVIETLTDLLKSAKKANAEGLDAKTWERVLRDKARGK